MNTSCSSIGSSKKNEDDINEASRLSTLFVFSGANKAGMEEVDKDLQAKIIYDMSRNSTYFKRAEKLDKASGDKIDAMKAKIERYNSNTLQLFKSSTDKSLSSLELKRNLSRICVVLDMDMFFAAVEIRDNPSLKDLPVAVGESIISTSNYVARKYGVRSAMPGFIAKAMCPNLVFVEPNFEKYQQVGKIIRSIISDYDKDFESHSLDEVYFDITSVAIQRYNSENQYCNNASESDSSDNDTDNGKIHDSEEERNHSGTKCAADSTKRINKYNAAELHRLSNIRIYAEKVVEEIRARIFKETGGLTSSAGIANNFMLAKICADINKPNGQYSLPPTRDSVINFISALPCRKIPGIGKVMEKHINELVRHIELLEKSRSTSHVCTSSSNLILSPKSSSSSSSSSTASSNEVSNQSQQVSLGNLRSVLHYFKPPLFSEISFKFLCHSCLGISRDESEDSEKELKSNRRSKASNNNLTKKAEYIQDDFRESISNEVKPEDQDYQKGNFDKDNDIDESNYENSEGKSTASKAESNNKISRKSLSVERTYGTIQSKSELFEKLYGICDSLSSNLVEEKLECKHITLKLKSSDFEVISKSLTTKAFIDSIEDIYSYASSLASSYCNSSENPFAKSNKVSIRLIGVRAAQFRCKGERHNNPFSCYFKVTDREIESNCSTNINTESHAILDSDNNSAITKSTETLTAIVKDVSGNEFLDDVDEDEVSLISVSSADYIRPENNSNSFQHAQLSETIRNSKKQTINQNSSGPINTNTNANVNSMISGVFTSFRPKSTSHEVINLNDEKSSKEKVQMSLSFNNNDNDNGNGNGNSNNNDRIRTNHLSEKVSFLCSKCNQTIKGTVIVVNAHIDSCILGIIDSKKKKRKLADFFQ